MSIGQSNARTGHGHDIVVLSTTVVLPVAFVLFFRAAGSGGPCRRACRDMVRVLGDRHPSSGGRDLANCASVADGGRHSTHRGSRCRKTGPRIGIRQHRHGLACDCQPSGSGMDSPGGLPRCCVPGPCRPAARIGEVAHPPAEPGDGHRPSRGGGGSGLSSVDFAMIRKPDAVADRQKAGNCDNTRTSGRLPPACGCAGALMTSDQALPLPVKRFSTQGVADGE
jgi:hypothetical protein